MTENSPSTDATETTDTTKPMETLETREAAIRRQFTLTRVFDAPRDLVFKAFSERDRLARWWGPKGCTVEAVHLDFRPGGVFHYSLRTPNGQVMWGRFVYRDIVAPQRIAFVSSFSDEQGGITRAPFSETWPREILNTLTLDENGGKTTLTLRGAPINATESEIRTFEDSLDSLRQGFTGTLDQLAVYLSEVQAGTRA